VLLCPCVQWLALLLFDLISAQYIDILVGLCLNKNKTYLKYRTVGLCQTVGYVGMPLDSQ